MISNVKDLTSNLEQDITQSDHYARNNKNAPLCGMEITPKCEIERTYTKQNYGGSTTTFPYTHVINYSLQNKEMY